MNVDSYKLILRGFLDAGYEARFFNENNCLGIFRKEFKDLVGEIDNGK